MEYLDRIIYRKIFKISFLKIDRLEKQVSTYRVDSSFTYEKQLFSKTQMH